jgi:hypothetical protein
MMSEFDKDKEVIKIINTQFQLSNNFMFQNQETFFSNEIDGSPFFSLNIEKSQNIELNEFNNIMEENKRDQEYEEEEDILDSLYFIKKVKNTNTELQSTECLTKASLSQGNTIFGKKEDFFHKIINFKTVLHHKRGRKEKAGVNKNKSNKYHGSDDFDNIQRKIQVHFINFLIGLANDILRKIFGKKNKLHFKDIKYNLKKIVNLKYVEYLKQCKFADILQMKISPKNKKFGEKTNKNTYLKACDNSEELKNIFDKNYLYIFQKYYFELKPNEKDINFEGKIIPLSLKTKGFYNLLEKNKFSKKFNDIIKDVYFTNTNYLNDKKFMITNSFNGN